MVVKERFLFVPELKEVSRGDAAGEEELVANKNDGKKTYQTYREWTSLERG